MPSSRFYTTEQLGAKQELTPEGFLLCSDVPLARIGNQIYSEQELPDLKARDGLINIVRDPEEVFKAEAIKSFAGKSVTNNHPPIKVVPDNWKYYTVGVVLHPRRGDGIDQDSNYLYADLLITDKTAIEEVRSGKREVSAGYDAEYEQLGDGEGRQYNIVGNHVALVTKGRCGPSCYIGDQQMPIPRRKLLRTTTVPTFDRSALMDAVRTANIDQAVEELNKIDEMLGEQVSGARDDDDDGHKHVVVNVHGSGGTSSPAASSGDDDTSGGGSSGEDINARLERIEQAIIALAQQGLGNEQDDPDEDYTDDRARRRTRDAGGENGDINKIAARYDYGANGAPGARDRAARRRRRSRDDEMSAPPSDDPDLDPANANTYGTGTGAADFRQSSAGGTNDRDEDDRRDDRRDDDRRTNDRRRTHDAAPVLTGDSANMRSEFVDAVSRAEVLVPGYKVPTFDSATPAKVTFDTICTLRRSVLEKAYHGDRRSEVSTMLGGCAPDFGKMTCDAVAMVYNGASELVRVSNNQKMVPIATHRGSGNAILTPADINERNRKRYGLA